MLQIMHYLSCFLTKEMNKTKSQHRSDKVLSGRCCALFGTVKIYAQKCLQTPAK